MIGPFKPVLGNFKFVFVLIDKFSKWIEYMPLVKASSKKAVEFLDQVIHRFGISNNIIIDLGTQFTGNTFWDFYDERSLLWDPGMALDRVHAIPPALGHAAHPSAPVA
jgi:hypothetical protein